MKKERNFFYLAGSVFGTLFLLMVVSGITSGLEAIAENRFGVEIPSPEPTWIGLVYILFLYIGILTILGTTASLKDEYTSYAIVAIAIHEFIESSNILFLKILPEITWAKTGDVLVFIAGLALLSLLVIIVAYHHKFFREMLSIEEEF